MGMRFQGRPDGKVLDADLILLSDIMAQKENALQVEIEEKAQQHRKWNLGHVDLTRQPLSPVHGQGSEMGFRPATAQYQYLMTPPSSVTSESFDHPSPAQEMPEPFSFRYGSPPEEDEPRGQPAYRRRIGRGGRLWIDRRGMTAPQKGVDTEISDRWKYDSRTTKFSAITHTPLTPRACLLNNMYIMVLCRASLTDVPLDLTALSTEMGQRILCRNRQRLPQEGGDRVS